MLFREFSVTSIRLVAASKGKVVAANIFGKIKTVTQLIAIIAVLLMQFLLEIFTMAPVFGAETVILLESIFTVISLCLIWISTIMALISGVIYIKQNWQYISEM